MEPKVNELTKAVGDAVANATNEVVNVVKPIAEDTRKVLSTAEQIFGISDITPEKLYVDPWKSYIYVRPPSASEKGKIEQIIHEGKSVETLKRMLFIMVVCDQDGNLSFSNKDIDRLGKKHAGAIEIVTERALEMIQITPEKLGVERKNS